MDPRATRRLTLELRHGGGPPEGVACEGEARRPFSGWLGLLSALDALLAAGAGDADPTRMEDADADHPPHRP